MRQRLPGGPIDPLTALARLADVATLLLLDGGPGGWSYLAWDCPVQPLRGLDDLPQIKQGTARSGAAPGWPAGIDGGALIQLDYEFPVGPWALYRDDGSVHGRCWRMERFLAWDPQGGCSLHGPDAATMAADVARLQRTAPGVPPPCVRATPRPAWDAAGHVRRVDAITAAIAAGTIYQANLTLPFQAELHPGPHRDLAVFSALRRRAPGCYGALLRHGGCTVISHSPECFLRSDGRDCCSEPIKGTRRREPGREAAVRAQLLAAAKDNAELAMIVDLVRNDLGRVAVPGGVAVAAPATVIDLSYVHHLVATVTARLHATVGHADLLAAAFPAGSITGAPKIAAMELIRELESGPRGAYCGCFGWLGAHGACELAVAIRTMVVRGNSVRFDAGGGIVVDSGGADEWQEVLAKIGPMAAALTSGACA